jgi:hypothetical protein
VTIDADNYIIDTEAPVPRWPGKSFGSYGNGLRGGDITMYHHASGAELTAYWPDDYVPDDDVDLDAGPELILIGTPCGVFFGRSTLDVLEPPLPPPPPPPPAGLYMPAYMLSPEVTHRLLGVGSGDSPDYSSDEEDRFGDCWGDGESQDLFASRPDAAAWPPSSEDELSDSEPDLAPLTLSPTHTHLDITAAATAAAAAARPTRPPSTGPAFGRAGAERAASP